MPRDIEEIYRQEILPLPEKERLKLAALIIYEISQTPEFNDAAEKPKREGNISKFSGMYKGGDPNGSDNEKFEADLARAYADAE